MDLELEKLYIRLIGDGSSALNMFKAVGEAAKGVVNVVENAWGKVGDLFGNLDEAAKDVFKGVSNVATETVSSIQEVAKGISADIKDITKAEEKLLELQEKLAKGTDSEGNPLSPKAKQKLEELIATQEEEIATAKEANATYQALKGTLSQVLSVVDDLAKVSLGPLHGLFTSLLGDKASTKIAKSILGESQSAIEQTIASVKPIMEAVQEISTRAVSETTDSIKGLIQTGLPEWLNSSKEALFSFAEANKETLIAVGAVTAAVVTLYGALRVLTGAFNIVRSVMSILGIAQIATIALWVALKIATLSYLVVVTSVRLAIATTIVTFGLLKSAWAAIHSLTLTSTAALSVFKAAWLAIVGVLSAVINGFNLILSGLVGIVALIPALAMFGTIGAVIYAAGNAIAEGGRALANIKLNGSQFQGAIEAGYELLDTVKLIIRAVAVDSELAWEAFKIGGRLAIEHLKQLWPPLWNFIKSAFAEVWTSVSVTFEEKMTQAIMRMSKVLPDWFGLDRAVDSAVEASNRLIRSTQRGADTRLQALVANFSLGGLDVTDAMHEARGRLAEIWGEVLAKEAKDKAAETGKSLGEAFVGGFKQELAQMQAVVTKSAEALARVRDYYDKLRNRFRAPSTESERSSGWAINPYSPISPLVGPRPREFDYGSATVASNTASMVSLLKTAVNTLIVIANKGGVPVVPADLPAL